MKQRCENPMDAGYPNYGGRGIQFEFNSVLEAGLWIQENLGLNRDLEIDRINNNGNYRPGNLRYATHRDQQFNKRNSKLTRADLVWATEKSPLALNTTRRLMADGLSQEDVVERAKKAVTEKRKSWRSIRDRLAQLGYTTC